MGKKIKKDKRKIVRSSLSGKIINGCDAIKTEEAFDYVIKQGFIIRPVKKKEIKLILQSLMLSIFLILSLSFLLMPLVSAEVTNQTGIFDIDFSNNHSIVLTTTIFAFAIFLYFFKKFIFSGLILIFLGIVFLTNNISPILAIITLIGGVYIIFTEDNIG